MTTRDPRAPLLAALLITLGCGSGSGDATDEGSTGTATATTTAASSSTAVPTSSGGETTGSVVTPDCTPILNQADLETGFEQCDDGSKHRYVALECPTEKTTDMNPCAPGPAPAGCTADGECTEMPLGYCAQAHMLSGYCGCYYGCQKDADCAPGSICECGVVVGQCVPATCTTNADCDPGLGCVATTDGTADGCIDPDPPTRYACQTVADECHGDLDCPADGINAGACLFDGDHRVCGSVCAQPP